MASVEEKVKHIIVEQLGVDADEVKSEASFVDDLGADSLQRWLIDLGYRCDRVGSKAGFRLLTVRHGAPT